MTEEPEGWQTLVLLGVRDLTPFKSEYLDSVCSLYKQYKDIKKQLNSVN